MKFQTVKREETKQAEKILREIVQNSVSNGFYNIALRDAKHTITIKIPDCFELVEEYPIVVLDKNKKWTTWDFPKDVLKIPDNEKLYNEYHSLKRSIDFVLVANGVIKWKRDRKIWVNDREGVSNFHFGCAIGFELVLTCDVDEAKNKDLNEYGISPIYKINTLELIKLYNQYQQQNALPQYIPVMDKL